ncbi:ExeA family protein [Solirhodobacter olei]|uniref:ExeA family protein n=1 Tax=Solirhodobacter olei TaxID=2493082 RepID=UPI000FDB732D|nr:AAA family ATPase [Solirhodobacter olei]
MKEASGLRRDHDFEDRSSAVNDLADPSHYKGFYADFYGFRERPFTLLPDPEMLLWAPQYRRAISVLEFGIASRSPITLLTGTIGCGKTTLIRELLARIEGGVTIGLISNAQGGRGELIQWIMNALGLKFDYNATYVTLFQQMQDFMVSEYAAGRRIILIFDEAQNLSQECLEELRMLTNINSGKDEVIQLVLVGQPELRDMIHRPSLVQLAQRIAASYYLEPLNEAQTAEFIIRRLKIAGGKGSEFAPSARALAYQVTGGVPRLINQLCEMALFYAWSMGRRRIDAAILEHVINDNIFFAIQPSKAPRSVVTGANPEGPTDQRPETLGDSVERMETRAHKA